MEVTLGAVWDVVLAAARLEHRAEEEQVLDHLPLARLVEVVQPAVLHELPHDLERDLVAPLVVRGHREVVDEDEHLLAARRAKVLPWRFSTEDSICRWKIDGVVACENDIFESLGSRIGLAEHLQDDRRLRRARAADQDHSALLRHREAEVVLAAHRVDRRDEQRGEALAELLVRLAVE